MGNAEQAEEVHDSSNIQNKRIYKNCGNNRRINPMSHIMKLWKRKRLRS